jgi:hypothetical protein
VKKNFCHKARRERIKHANRDRKKEIKKKVKRRGGRKYVLFSDGIVYIGNIHF